MADNLSVFENKGNFMATHFENSARAFATGFVIAETGVEKSRIVNAKLSDQRVKWCHFGSKQRRNVNCFAWHENIKLVRIKDERMGTPIINRFPKIKHFGHATLVDVDNAGMMLAAISHKSLGIAREINRKPDAACTNIGIVIGNQHFFFMKGQKFAFIQPALSFTETDLRQSWTGANNNRKCTRTYFEIKFSMITIGNFIKFLCVIGYDACENIQSSGRAFRVGRGTQLIGKCERFDKRYNIDAARFKHRTVFQIEFV